GWRCPEPRRSWPAPGSPTAKSSPRRSPRRPPVTWRGGASVPSRSTAWVATPPRTAPRASDTMAPTTRPTTQGVTVEVKIGVQNVARELVLDASGTEDEIETAVKSALDGGALVLTDDKGRRVMVPAGAL